MTPIFPFEKTFLRFFYRNGEWEFGVIRCARKRVLRYKVFLSLCVFWHQIQVYYSRDAVFFQYIEERFRTVSHLSRIFEYCIFQIWNMAWIILNNSCINQLQTTPRNYSITIKYVETLYIVYLKIVLTGIICRKCPSSFPHLRSLVHNWIIMHRSSIYQNSYYQRFIEGIISRRHTVKGILSMLLFVLSIES